MKKWFLILIIISHSHQSRKKFRKIETHILKHPIYSIFVYLSVCGMSVSSIWGKNRQKIDRQERPHFTRKHYDVWVQERARAAIISKMTMMSCCTNRVCYDLFFNNRPIRVGTLLFEFQKRAGISKKILSFYSNSILSIP